MPPTEETPTPQTPILDRAALDRLCADLGGREGLPVIAQLFAQTAARTLDELTHALDAGDAHEVIRLTHSLKSSSRYVAAVALGQAAEKAEEHARAGAMPAVRATLGALHAAVQAATAALDQELGNGGDEAPH